MGGYGCNGGTAGAGFEYLTSSKAILEDVYPYANSNSTTTIGTCDTTDMETTDILVASWNKVESFHGTQTKAALMTGPVGILINAATTQFIYYTSGIFDCDSSVCRTDWSSLDHAVLLVGWGVENDIEYFILKN